MAYGKSSFFKVIEEDLDKMKNRRETVPAGFLERAGVKKVPTSQLHVNPKDEFSFPNIGPSDSIIENYSQIARRNQALGKPVYPEPIVVCKLKEGGYLI